MAEPADALDNDTRRVSLADVYRLALDQAGRDVQTVLGHAIDSSDEDR